MTTMHSLSIVLAALLVTATAVLLAHGDDQAGALDRFPRVRLAHLPPPLEEMGRLSAELGGPRLLIKRDDQTGLAFGGNKARKLEYIFADVLAKQADVVITYAGQQSNWARQTAAAARKFGIQPILVLRKVAVGEVAFEGNLLLDEILDADVRLIEPDESREEMVEEIAATERKKGRTPYVVSVGGSRTEGSMTRPLGAVAYAKGFQELYEQARTQNVRITHVVAATGSGGTQAGLLVGAKALDADVEIVGISVSGKNPAVEQTVLDLATQTSDALGLDTSISADDVIVFDDYVDPGYGIVTKAVVEGLSLIAQNEGIMIDPVYTGKAMVGLIDLIRNGYFQKDDTVVFLHTGGTPALFAFGAEILELLPNPPGTN